MWYIDVEPSHSSWSMTLPFACRNASMTGVVDGRVDDHLRVGPLEGLGADPAEQRLERLRMSRVGGDLEDPVVLDECVAPDRLPLAGDPDHVGLAAADHPPPVVFGADDRAVGPGILAVVERHQVVQLRPGARAGHARIRRDPRRRRR